MSADETITFMALVTVKEGLEKSYLEASRDLIKKVRAEEEGCLNYTLYRRGDNPREFVFLEQYRDQQAMRVHMAGLVERFGPPAPGETVPAGLLAFLDKFELVVYNDVSS